VDRAGNLYIADANNAVVRKVSNGIITTVAGAAGYPGCDNCAATRARLERLLAVTTDPAGTLYILSDALFSKVSNGVIANYPADALAAEGEYTAAAADAAGNVYLADTLVTASSRSRIARPRSSQELGRLGSAATTDRRRRLSWFSRRYRHGCGRKSVHCRHRQPAHSQSLEWRDHNRRGLRPRPSNAVTIGVSQMSGSRSLPWQAA